MNTTKLGLKKPEGTDLVNIQDLNENVDVIEQQLEQRPIKTGDASNMTTSFTQATAVGNIASGEAIKTSFGKIAKTIADYVSHKATTATTSILGHVRFGTAAGTACQGNDSRLSDSRIPKSHAVTTTTYGIGTASNYGHVKLSDTYNSTVTNGAAVNGMAASQKAVADFYNQINSNLTKIGTYKLIAKTLATDTPGNWAYKQVDNMSVYKYILLAKCDVNASFLNSIQVPVGIFKSLNSTKKTLAIEDSGVKIYACYMGDTSVGLYCQNVTYRAELYGVY